jgi:hypothetical protein
MRDLPRDPANPNGSSPANRCCYGHPAAPCVAIAFFWASMRGTALEWMPIWPPQGGLMKDQSREVPLDADLRKLARLVSACTLGLWAFAAGLLIGTFLFS